MFVLLMLGGCTFPAYERELHGWLNQPSDKLIAAWGTPHRVVDTADGGRDLEYAKQIWYGDHWRGGSAARGEVPVPVQPVTGVAPRVHYCSTVFHVEPGGIVSGYRFTGDRCGEI